VRRLVVVGVLAGSVACGGFLGFGDDDDEGEPPVAPAEASTSDAVSNADASEGGTTVVPLPPGCTRHTFTTKGAADVDAAVLAQGWDSNLVGNTSMAIEDGQLVLRSAGVKTDSYDEANVSFRHDGKLARLTCTTNVVVSSFAGDSRYVQLRLYEPRWTPWFSAYALWEKGEVGAPTQGVYVADGGTADEFPARKPAPPAGGKLPLLVELVSDPPSFRVQLGDVEIAHTPTPFGFPDIARVIFGTLTAPGTSAGPYEVRYDDIECIACDAQ
jgi:hypothetical protein